MTETNETPEASEKKSKRRVIHITNEWILDELQKEQAMSKEKTTTQTCLRLLIGAIREEQSRRERAANALGAAMLPK